MEKSKKIYMDYASATPIDKSVISIMLKTMKDNFENPSSIHNGGIEVKRLIDKARGDIAQILKSQKNQIIFTSGATESNNLAILGILEECREFSIDFVPHIITTNIEHPSVLEVCKYLEKTKKAEITYISVEKNGIIDPKKIKTAIKSNTVLISVMYANNEIGTIQPIEEIAKEIRHYKKINKKDIYIGRDGLSGRFPFFHSDASQAVNYLSINVEKLGVDLLSFNSAKIYGPKGIGALFVKRNNLIKRIMLGGDQEFNLRPGTENIVLAMAFSEALKITEKIKIKEFNRLTKLRNYFLKELEKKIIFKLNGDIENRLPNNINITIPEIPSDLLVVELSAKDIYISERSACKSGDKKGSYVINAISTICKKTNSLRFSLGRQTTKNDIDYTIKVLDRTILKLKKWYI